MFVQLPTMSQTETALGALIAAGTILAATYRVGRVVWRGTRQAWHTLELVHAQLVPNGGRSLADAIARIEEWQERQAIRLHVLLSSYRCGLYETDAQGRCQWVSDRYVDLTGQLPRDLNGANWATAIAEADRDRVQAEWMHCTTDARRFDLHYHISRPDGTLLLVHGRAWPVMQRGVLVGFVGEICPVEPVPGQ